MWHLCIEIRPIKYRNSIIEHHHRGIKRVTKQMLGFKLFDPAEKTTAWIELDRMLKKRQMESIANTSI
jgi:putative transposase